MPEARVVLRTYGLGGYDSTRPNNNLVEEITAEISDEQLAEEAEQKAMEKAEDLIDSITNLADAKVFLKRLVRRLIKNSSLP